MNGYIRAKELIKELENLNEMMRVHQESKVQTIMATDKQTFDLQTKFITLRLRRAAAELAFVAQEFEPEYLRAKRDLKYQPVEPPSPLRIFAMEKVAERRRKNFGERLVEFFKLQKAA
jgi:hypothetical protein